MIPGIFRRPAVASQTSGRRDIVKRYKSLRAVGIKLNSRLVERLTTDVLEEGGKRLGIFRNKTFVFNTQDETSVLMDYCLYEVRREGRNAIEQYLIDCPPEIDSDEMICLQAMQHAFYSLFIVDAVEPGFGVTVRDLLSDRILCVVDMGFGQSAEPGLVFASRIVAHDGFCMTGGAPLPVSVLPENQRDVEMKRLASAITTNDSGEFDPAPLIRSCLQHDSSSHVEYREPSAGSSRQQEIRRPDSHQKVGRNDSCPCGSGRKYKKCCGIS